MDQNLHLSLKTGNELSLRGVQVGDVIYLRPPAALFIGAVRKVAFIGKCRGKCSKK
jgi:hypothetical protein